MVNDIVLLKMFDNGMICVFENSVIIDKEIYVEVKVEFICLGCYYVKFKDV